MSYTGNVSVGGPPQTREVVGLTITKVAVGPMDNNAYLLRCASTGDLLLIDAANEPETLLNLIGGQPLATIVTTHLHGDHWQALEAGAQATGGQTRAQLHGAPRPPPAAPHPIKHREQHPGADAPPPPKPP